FGKNRPFLSALINIDMTTVGRWAAKERIVYTEFSDLSVNNRVIKLIQQEVKRLMEELPPQERVKRFMSLQKQFSADAGELTRTLKIRRNFVENAYKELIDAMYSNNQLIQVRISETESVEEIPLRIVQLEQNLEVPEDVLLANAY